jgi:hypothetical protein
MPRDRNVAAAASPAAEAPTMTTSSTCSDYGYEWEAYGSRSASDRSVKTAATARVMVFARLNV